MAIYSAVPPPEQQASPVATALQTPSPGVDKTVTLTIPLDKHDEAKEARPRKEPLRRDSLKGREALLRGKEGSRRRQRWENGNYAFPAILPSHLIHLSPSVSYPYHCNQY